MRCLRALPACAAFEATASPELARRAVVGLLEIEYVLASLLDRTLGGGDPALW
ncbi:hypothetical protein ACFVYD_03570 [Streptomyces sp. NPDC058301]|uniref:hypothetical protein n=1 Tax=Streptomyces sp. NPDC058301 TaxID=3346436 RepID=UPI0036E974F2